MLIGGLKPRIASLVFVTTSGFSGRIVCPRLSIGSVNKTQFFPFHGEPCALHQPQIASNLFNTLLWRLWEYDDDVQTYESILPLHYVEYSVYSTLKCCWAFFNSKGARLTEAVCGELRNQSQLCRPRPFLSASNQRWRRAFRRSLRHGRI